MRCTFVVVPVGNDRNGETGERAHDVEAIKPDRIRSRLVDLIDRDGVSPRCCCCGRRCDQRCAVLNARDELLNDGCATPATERARRRSWSQEDEVGRIQPSDRRRERRRSKVGASAVSLGEADDGRRNANLRAEEDGDLLTHLGAVRLEVVAAVEGNE